MNTIVMLILRSLHTIIFFAFFCSPFIYADTFKEGGDAYKKGEYAIAEIKFLEVAEKSDHRAMYALGSMYAGGTGVVKDYRKAYKWFSAAAKYGRIDAQYKLALMYDEGVGITQNYRRAARLYNKIAKKGYALAQFRLGLLYASGHGVKQSHIKAYAWLTLAKLNLEQSLAGEKERKNEIEQGSSELFATVHTELIAAELEKIRTNIGPQQLEHASQLVQEYSQYR